MSLILDKLDTLANAADEAGQSRAAAELRDKFAMAALQSDFVGDCTSAETVAHRAYRGADAMMAERAK